LAVFFRSGVRDGDGSCFAQDDQVPVRDYKRTLVKAALGPGHLARAKIHAGQEHVIEAVKMFLVAHARREMGAHLLVFEDAAGLELSAFLFDFHDAAATMVSGGDKYIIVHDNRRGDIGAVACFPWIAPERFALIRRYADQAAPGK